jgi:hypothetical protein
VGGWGSGRQGGRVTVEGCASGRLGTRDLRGLLRSPAGGNCWISYRRDGEHLMTVTVEARPDLGYLRLRHPSRASGHVEPMDYSVDLTWTVLGFGGRRWWFSCPVSGRRCAVLYLPRGARGFGSARGYGLAHATTRMPEHDRLWHKMARIARRLGDEPDPEIPPRKPRWMRAATHGRLLRAWHDAAERRDGIYDTRIAGFLARLDRLEGRLPG